MLTFIFKWRLEYNFLTNSDDFSALGLELQCLVWSPQRFKVFSSKSFFLFLRYAIITTSLIYSSNFSYKNIKFSLTQLKTPPSNCLFGQNQSDKLCFLVLCEISKQISSFSRKKLMKFPENVTVKLENISTDRFCPNKQFDGGVFWRGK